MSSRLKWRLAGLITVIHAIIGIALGSLLYFFWPGHYFKWYPSIPIFYWMMGLAMAFFLDQVKKKHGDMIVTIYMLVRLSKFVVVVIFLWIYALLVGSHVRSFGLTLMLFYFIHLALETYIFYLFEKRRIKRNDKKIG